MKFIGATVVFALAGAAQAAVLGADARAQRAVTLYQSGPAEWHDQFPAPGPGPYQFVDLPAPPLAGSCALPGAEVRQIGYPAPASPSVGDSVRLYVSDPQLGAPIQAATVAWRDGQQFGLALQSGPAKGAILPWQAGAAWAQLLQAPEQTWLSADAQADADLSLRCAAQGPAWSAHYQATREGDALWVHLDALIRVPAAQDWGVAAVTLSSQVGAVQAPMMMARVADFSAESGPSVSDGQWRYRFEGEMAMVGGSVQSRRLFSQRVPIQRQHELSFGFNYNQPALALRANRVWTLTNRDQGGAARAWVAGQLRINGPAPEFELEGQASLPDLAVGASHRLRLGPSLALQGQLRQNRRVERGTSWISEWTLTLENGSDEPLTAVLRPQIARDAVIDRLPGQRVMAPGEVATLVFSLTEPKRR